MAIFEYKCEKCGTVKDRIVSYEKRNDPAPCPENNCEGKLQHVDKIHSSGFQLKGSGWFNSGGY